MINLDNLNQYAFQILYPENLYEYTEYYEMIKTNPYLKYDMKVYSLVLEINRILGEQRKNEFK